MSGGGVGENVHTLARSEVHEIDGPKKTNDAWALSDSSSTITSDTLIVFRKKFHFPNDMIVRVPKKSERAHHPPSGFFTCSEMMLRAGLRFPLAPELIEIFKRCDVALSQFSFRVLVVIVGLTVFFRERGATLDVKYLCGLCKLLGDSVGRVTCRGIKNGVHFLVPSPSKIWSSGFFFVQNEWCVQEKWGKFKGLRDSTCVEESEILKLLNISSMESLQVELHHIGRFVIEDRLFKVGLSIHIGRSYALPLKRSNPSTQKLSCEHPRDDDAPILKKKKTSGLTEKSNDEATYGKNSDKASKNPNGGVRPSQIHIPEEVLKHICTGRQQTDELVSQVLGITAHLNVALDEWNTEFVKTKYLRGEYEKRFLSEMKKVAVLGDELTECRTELANMVTALSFQRQEADRSREELIDVRAEARDKERRIRELMTEKKALQRENERLQKDIAEKDSVLSKDRTAAVSLKAVEDFKNSLHYRSIIEDHIQKARDYIFDVEVKELERQSLEEGFTRGFLKALRLVHRKTGADMNGISLSQVSEDHPEASEDGDIESVLKEVLPSDDEDDVDIVE